MGFFDKLIKMITRNKQKLLDGVKLGYKKDEYYYKYLKDLKRIEYQIKQDTKSLEKYYQSYLKLQNRDFSEYFPDYAKVYQSNKDEYDKELTRVYNECIRYKRYLDEGQMKIKFARPETSADNNERKIIENKFCDSINNADSNGVLNLRFHGTSIHMAKEIIESGGIFSSVDTMNGYVSSTNASNEISVTCLNSVNYEFKNGMLHPLQFSINMMDIACDSYPAGCMFVLIPRNKEESDMIRFSQMHNVNFRESPETLYAIMTTTENIDRVKSWMNEKGLDSSKVYTMDELLKKVEKDVWKKGQVEPTTELKNSRIKEDTSNKIQKDVVK